MYIFFDTETTGLPKNWQAPLSDLNNWPRMVQLAWLVYDATGTKLSGRDYIIKPEGYEIPDNAARVHGITTARAMAEGVALVSALEEFARDMQVSQYLVAHNMSFDERIAGAEFLRKNISNSLLGIEKVCTMESSTEFVNIMGNYGKKWPTLAELHMKLFNEGFENAHNAIVDVEILAKCFFALKGKGVL